MKLNSCLHFKMLLLKRKDDYITNINILFKYYLNGAICINLSDSIIGKDIYQFFAIQYLIKLMPPKKKADIKADKAEKAKPKASVSKSPPKVADSKAKNTRGKDKADPVPQPVPVAAKGRRAARQPSPVPDPTPAKKVKGAKSPEPKAPEPKSAKKDKSPPKADKKDEPAKVDPKPAADDKKDEQQIVKVVTKGGVAVDNEVNGKENYRVYQEGGKTYAVTLNLADLQ